MPKERLHLLLAGQSLQVLTSSLGSPLLSEAQEFAYFLGAISPDALFYDLPRFRLPAAGEALHRLEGKSCLPFLESICREQRRDLEPETVAWILGVANHFLADGIWHPIIRKLSDPDTSFCRAFKFSKRQCHYGLESELEAFWLARIGPPDGYLPLLRQFMRGTKRREDCAKCFRIILMQRGFNQIHDERMIGRCFFLQALLLRLFSLAALAKWRTLLVHLSLTRYLGALIVPVAEKSSPLAKSNTPWESPLEDPYDDAFMARSVISLAKHLHELSLKLI
jgi:hypothetical protein